jgi:hypothetical protein
LWFVVVLMLKHILFKHILFRHVNPIFHVSSSARHVDLNLTGQMIATAEAPSSTAAVSFVTPRDRAHSRSCSLFSTFRMLILSFLDRCSTFLPS